MTHPRWIHVVVSICTLNWIIIHWMINGTFKVEPQVLLHTQHSQYQPGQHNTGSGKFNRATKGGTSTDSGLPDNNVSSNSTSICEMLQTPWGAPSASGIVSATIERILQSSRISQDNGFQQEAFTRGVFKLIAARLPNSVKSVIRGRREWSKVDNILQKAHRRWKFLVDESDTGKPEPPPVKILIMGGSVTRGTNCNVHGMTRFDCAWPNRLEQLINQFVGHNIVEVHVAGAGGTNSAVGTTILRDELVRSEARQPDILINSYSTNDMHVITMAEAKEGNMTLGEKVFEISQQFTREALNVTCGTEPLLFWLDDYFGNEQSEIMATMQLGQSIYSLASYYGFGYVSYVDMVRDWVYGDTRETLFSPPGWYNNGKYQREIHPGVGGHMTIAWAIAFNFIHTATEFCSTRWIPMSEEDEERLLGQPKPVPQGLPPWLNQSTSLEKVSDIWRSTPIKTSKTGECPQKCIFSWVSGIDREQNDPIWIERHFQPFLLKQKGWELPGKDNNNKVGYVPEKGAALGASWTLQFENIGQQIRSVTLFSMKSYRSKWKDSAASFSVSSRNSSASTWHTHFNKEVQGIHNKHTSEVYQDAASVDVHEGHSLKVDVSLSGGKTFKIMGVAVCS